MKSIKWFKVSKKAKFKKNNNLLITIEFLQFKKTNLKNKNKVLLIKVTSLTSENSLTKVLLKVKELN